MKTVRAALWPLLERAQALLTPDLEAELRSAFVGKEKISAEFFLHQHRETGIGLANAGTPRQWQKALSGYGSDKHKFVVYAAAAWIARTIILAETLERSTLLETSRKWAAGAALSFVQDFESEEAWLWPFDSDPPWAEEEDDDEG